LERAKQVEEEEGDFDEVSDGQLLLILAAARERQNQEQD
jgi:hypothetical protein